MFCGNRGKPRISQNRKEIIADLMKKPNETIQTKPPKIESIPQEVWLIGPFRILNTGHPFVFHHFSVSPEADSFNPFQNNPIQVHQRGNIKHQSREFFINHIPEAVF
jgi:hypothetical protein